MIQDVPSGQYLGYERLKLFALTFSIYLVFFVAFLPQATGYDPDSWILSLLFYIPATFFPPFEFAGGYHIEGSSTLFGLLVMPFLFSLPSLFTRPTKKHFIIIGIVAAIVSTKGGAFSPLFWAFGGIPVLLSLIILFLPAQILYRLHRKNFFSSGLGKGISALIILLAIALYGTLSVFLTQGNKSINRLRSEYFYGGLTIEQHATECDQLGERIHLFPFWQSWYEQFYCTYVMGTDGTKFGLNYASKLSDNYHDTALANGKDIFLQTKEEREIKLVFDLPQPAQVNFIFDADFSDSNSRKPVLMVNNHRVIPESINGSRHYSLDLGFHEPLSQSGAIKNSKSKRNVIIELQSQDGRTARVKLTNITLTLKESQ